MPVSGWRKISHDNTNQKKVEVAILISDRVEFGVRKVFGNKEGHCCSPRRRSILNVYACNNIASKCMRQKPTEVQRKRDEFTVIVGNFSTHPFIRNGQIQQAKKSVRT